MKALLRGGASHAFNIPKIELNELLAIVAIELRDKGQADRRVAQTVACSHIEADSVEELAVFLNFQLQVAIAYNHGAVGF